MPFLSPTSAIRVALSRRSSGGSKSAPDSLELEKSDLSMSTSVRSSSFDEKMIVRELLEFCKDSNIQFSQETAYRFAAFHGFDIEQTKDAIQDNKNNHYLSLEMKGSLQRQIATQAIFPLSGLQTRKDKMDVIYIQASRLDPNASDGSTARIMENLCYVLNDLSRTKEQCLCGVAVIIIMKSLEESAFNLDFWMQLMMGLQGNLVPTTVNRVFLVDPPKWFQRKHIWKNHLKSKLQDSFAKKCRFINAYDLLIGDYFVEGCKAYFPTTVGGWKHDEEIVEDYLDLKEFEYQQSAVSQDV